jgi:hypothetical protein
MIYTKKEGTTELREAYLEETGRRIEQNRWDYVLWLEGIVLTCYDKDTNNEC